jgi:hypothetical protein
MLAAGYGLPRKIYKFRKAGDLVYIRTEEADRISDHRAVICGAMYLAYLSDGEFQDLEKAKLYQGLYRQRIARLTQVRQKNADVRRRGRFY